MDKTTPPISKPEKFGVSNQEVIDLASKLREGLPTHDGVLVAHQEQAGVAPGHHQPAPRVVIS